MPRQCTVCTETYGNSQFFIIDHSPLCHGCIIGYFKRAISNEKYYPPKWGDVPLTPGGFGTVVPLRIRRMFKVKEGEYLTPPDERIYCLDGMMEGMQCGEYVGKKLEFDEARDFMQAGILVDIRCKTCNTPHCQICGSLASHTLCSGPDKDDNDPTSAYYGLTKGKDYQICPKQTCKRRIQLKEACNHIHCPCSTYFCFICGQEADVSHYHRRLIDGVCPRYGHPDSDNAIYNQPFPDVVLNDPEGITRLQRQLIVDQAHRRRNAIVGLGGDQEEAILMHLAAEVAREAERQAAAAAALPLAPVGAVNPPPEAIAWDRARLLERLRALPSPNAAAREVFSQRIQERAALQRRFHSI